MQDNVLATKTKLFALKAISLSRELQKDNEFVVSKQFLRSATSIGANLREAIVGQSKKDFYAKICICYKEAHESAYWLELI
jgi:four helix bundle protein